MNATAQIRPKFKIITSMSPFSIIEEIRSLLCSTNSINGKIIDDQVYLQMPEKDQHYWSPELRLTITENETGSLIKGHAGPNGKVWATFMVFYGLAVMLFIFGGSLGISQLMLNIESNWIWSIPVSFVMYIAIIISAKFGQRLGNDQLIRLRYFLDEAVINAENKELKINPEIQ